jgi:hypothetical protein
MKNEICDEYLVNLFDSDIRFVNGYGYGYDFVQHDNEWGSYEPKYAIRISRLTEGNKSWTAKLEPTAAEYILFFGFRSVNKRWGDLEFCLRLPMAGDFKDRNKITIPDDRIVLREYAQYSVDSQTLDKMKDVMTPLTIMIVGNLWNISPNALEKDIHSNTMTNRSKGINMAFYGLLQYQYTHSRVTRHLACNGFCLTLLLLG